MPGPLAGRFDGTGTFKFGFVLDGHTVENVKSVEGLTLKIDKVETRSTDAAGKPYHTVFAGNKQFLGSLSVTRILNDNPAWFDWYQEALHNIVSARKTGTVNVYGNDAMGGVGGNETPIRVYTFMNCFPIELKVSGMNAGTPNPIEETITFVYEELDIG
jgi:phage tail-like protein